MNNLIAKATYSSLLYEVKNGALTTQKEQSTCGESRTWSFAQIAWYVIFLNVPSITISFNKTSTRYWKCLTTRTGLLLNKRHRSWKLKILNILFWKICSLCSLFIIETSSFHLKSSAESVMKKVGTPNCFTMGKMLNFFQ